MQRAPFDTLGSFATAVMFVAAVTLTLVLGTPKATSVKASRAASPAAAKPAATPYPITSHECPHMDNPGGRLLWQPSADAGPWTTDGTVSVPALGVQAPIVKVGINSAGDMVVPRSAHQVAWLDQGSFPGRTQNAVLAGHIKWSGVTGSFNRIGELQQGDEIVVTAGGKVLTFEVEWTCAFDRDTDLAPQIMGYTNEPSVTLITCGGVFDSAAGTHNKRIAVRAELISTERLSA